VPTGPLVHHESRILVDAKAAAALLAVSERKFHGLRKEPGFPFPVLLGSRAVRWRIADLRSWVDRLPAAPAAPEPRQLARSRVFRSGKEVTKRPRKSASAPALPARLLRGGEL
jgi:predicted DNA-binding transcriptional regulator AlpA